jgi:uridine kinase
VILITSARLDLISRLAASIVGLGRGRLRVGVDGVDGAGKTMFGAELATSIRSLGRPVVEASIDSFHRPRIERYRRGRSSPEGFYRDSYDLDRFLAQLLEPLSAGGSGVHRRSAFDVDHDLPVVGQAELAGPDSVLILDGLFLHRAELRDHWDFSILLDVDFAISIPRCALRDSGVGSADPNAPSNRRYVEGQRIYFRDAEPRRHASVVIDNNDLGHPRIVSAGRRCRL